VVLPMALILTALAPEGLALWVGDEFAVPGAPVARWLLLGILINAVAQVPFAFLQGVGRPDLTAKVHLLEAPVYFVLLWWLLGGWGITGAAVAWTLRVFLDAVLLFWLSGRVLPSTRKAALEIAAWTALGLLFLGLAAWAAEALALRVGLVVLFGGVWGLAAWFRLLPRPARLRSGSGGRRS
jgi:O-antigen/teichoic acid export membrane protein